MAETETEFLGYTGDCVWAAVHMGAHRLAPAAWLVPSATILDRLTSEAIAAGIGVGPRGEATPGQLKTMLARWGMRYSVGYDYDGATISQPSLKLLLDGVLARGKPVLLGFTNGQALTGDEVGLHGHEIVVLHPAVQFPNGLQYPCGDGDNPKCAVGQLVYYSLGMLEAAQPDSAYILEEVPGMLLEITQVSAYFTETKLADGTVKWTGKPAGHQFDIDHGLLEFFRSVYLPPAGFLGLPIRPIMVLPEKVRGKGLCYELHLQRCGVRYDPARQYDNPPGVSGPCYLIQLSEDAPPPDPAVAARAAAFEQIKTALAVA